MQQSEPAVELQDVTKTFPVRTGIGASLDRGRERRHVAVDGVTLEVARGDALGLVGESGSGKTTIARMLVGLVGVDAGSIRVNDEDVTNAKGADLRRLRQKVQLIYQNPYSSLNPRLTVGSTLAEAAHIAGGVPKLEVNQRVESLLQQVGLDSALRDRRPSALSGGQRQRVAIARALAANPEVLIADEATSALDVSIQAQILALFEGLRDELGLTLIFISHQLAAVAHVCSRIAIMYRGQIVEEGGVRAIFDRPAHPYTAGLMAAHPDPYRPRFPRARAARTGLVPNAGRQACVYVERCPIALEICTTLAPERSEIPAGRSSRCHRSDELLSHRFQGDEAVQALKEQVTPNGGKLTTTQVPRSTT
jgi:oligopeptide/dipeptide ABC transporter ATP-binding protein